MIPETDIKLALIKNMLDFIFYPSLLYFALKAGGHTDIDNLQPLQFFLSEIPPVLRVDWLDTAVNNFNWLVSVVGGSVEVLERAFDFCSRFCYHVGTEDFPAFAERDLRSATYIFLIPQIAAHFASFPLFPLSVWNLEKRILPSSHPLALDWLTISLWPTSQSCVCLMGFVQIYYNCCI